MSTENNEPMSHKEFFEKALTSAGEWTRFTDPKALGVAVFLSFGATDVLRNAGKLYYGLDANTFWEWMANVSLVGTTLLGFATVAFVSLALFPRLKPEGPRSHFYFASIAQIDGPSDYEQEVRNKSPQELEKEIAYQAWNVAKTAATKHRWTQTAYWTLVLFLVLWVVGRIALSFV